MRRMFSLKQLIALIKEHAVSGLLGKDINVEGITSKGIANTGNLANIGDVAVTGDISASGEVTASTLKQSQANKQFDISYVSKEGITITKRYAKALVINNILYIISSIVASNETDSSISSVNFAAGTIILDDETADKIICVNGEKVSDDFSAEQDISEFCSVYGAQLTSLNARRLRKTAKNTISFYVALPANFAVNDAIQSFGRQFLLLF